MGKLGYRGGISQFSKRQGDSGCASRFFKVIENESENQEKESKDLEFTSEELDVSKEIEGSRFFYCAKASSSERNAGLEGMQDKNSAKIGKFKENAGRNINMGNTVSKNHHPTVKPIRLMEYLIKLVMPKDGILLDPFAGSGTTLLAAKNLNMKALGIEKEAEYVEICNRRLAF